MSASRSTVLILVVDDEDAMREVLTIRLESLGYRVASAATAREARALAETLDPAVVISDVVLPDASGLELLQRLKAGNPARPVILITAYGTIEAAVTAMKHGALDFLTKPIDHPRLQATIARALVPSKPRDGRDGTASPPGRNRLGDLVGGSEPMRALFRLIEVLGESEASALITGESGTGKEVVAQTIHDLSERRNGPFMAVNSAAIPEGIIEGELFGHEKGAFTGAISSRAGWFEQADGGTLFLDELAEMPIALQPKLLRVLESRQVRRLGGRRAIPFDVRLVAATNREPARAIRDGFLREDLYYRLNVFTVELPPLRERGDDVPRLAEHFVSMFNKQHRMQVRGLAPETIHRLCAYRWPGNVRELRNAMERAVILARRGLIKPAHLPDTMLHEAGDQRAGLHLPPGVSHAEAERILIVETLKRAGNNKAKAARQLGLDVKTIRNKLRTYATALPP